jgi:hypothetical protein
MWVLPMLYFAGTALNVQWLLGRRAGCYKSGLANRQAPENPQ